MRYKILVLTVAAAVAGFGAGRFGASLRDPEYPTHIRITEINAVNDPRVLVIDEVVEGEEKIRISDPVESSLPVGLRMYYPSKQVNVIAHRE